MTNSRLSGFCAAGLCLVLPALGAAHGVIGFLDGDAATSSAGIELSSGTPLAGVTPAPPGVPGSPAGPAASGSNGSPQGAIGAMNVSAPVTAPPADALPARPSTAGNPAPPPFALDLGHALKPGDDHLRAPETADLIATDLGTPPKGLADGEEAYDDLWDRIRENFGLTSPDGNRVTQQIVWFENHRDYVARLAERSRRYLYFIVDEVEKRGMPSEIALLPIVESAFNPQALSRTKASGIWQFMPETGRLYGLRQNWWYDGRRDVVAATSGALDYLEKLHAQFGAWDLALAAYNCGEGAVARAIEHNQRLGKPTDYASLALPEETRNYIPKLLAAREIVTDPEAHGLTLPVIPDAPYFATVTTRRHVDLAVAARFANLSESEFLALNPGYNRPLILAQGEQTILVPVQVADTFTARLNDPNAHLVSWRAHRLRRGESLANVASRFGMSSAELKRVNGIAANRRVAGGGTILVRDAQADEGDLDALTGNAAVEANLAPPTETLTFSHRVRRGESLASIARHYNVGISSLRTWNRIPRSRGARLGQILVMHRTTEAGEDAPPADTASAGASEQGRAQVTMTGHKPTPTRGSRHTRGATAHHGATRAAHSAGARAARPRAAAHRGR